MTTSISSQLPYWTLYNTVFIIIMQRLPPQFYLQDIAAINGHVSSCKLRVTTDPSYKWSIQLSSPFISYYPRLTPRKTRTSHKISHQAVKLRYDMSDIGIPTKAPEPCAYWFTSQRWRCMRVARIARIMNWKLHGFIVSMNTQQDVGVHTHTTRHGRNTRHAKHQQLYRKRNSRDIRTWRCIDANMFVTENTSGNRNDHEWAQKNCACKY